VKLRLDSSIEVGNTKPMKCSDFSERETFLLRRRRRPGGLQVPIQALMAVIDLEGPVPECALQPTAGWELAFSFDWGARRTWRGGASALAEARAGTPAPQCGTGVLMVARPSDCRKCPGPDQKREPPTSPISTPHRPLETCFVEAQNKKRCDVCEAELASDRSTFMEARGQLADTSEKGMRGKSI